MPLKELVSERFFSIFLDDDESWLYVDWTGYQNTESVQRGCNQMLESMVKHQAFRVLNDNTHVVGIWSGASEWVATDWFPRMQSAGLECFAWVYSPSRFSQLSTDATLSFMDADSVGVRVFDNILQAREWLRTHGCERA